MRYIKYFYLVYVDEYTIGEKSNMSRYLLVVPYRMNNMDIILLKVKSNHWYITHNYGICNHKSIAEGKKTNEDNSNTLCIYTVQL